MSPTPLTIESIQQSLSGLHKDWCYREEERCITREFKTQGFNQALLVTNLCASVAEHHNHHPDISLGWGYCSVTFTTHSAKALTALDIDCARKLDVLCSGLFDGDLD